MTYRQNIRDTGEYLHLKKEAEDITKNICNSNVKSDRQWKMNTHFLNVVNLMCYDV